MVEINDVLNVPESGRDRGYYFGRYQISVGPEIDGFLNLRFPGEPLPRLPYIVCSTEQTTAFTAHVYNVGTSSCSIVVHRMDQGPAPGGNPPQTFWVNVVVFF